MYISHTLRETAHIPTVGNNKNPTITLKHCEV